MAANTPFRTYATFAHFSGVRDPMFIAWPARILQTGLRSQFCHAVDLAPTVLEAAGLEPPAAYHGVAQQPLHGTSLVYAFDEPNADSKKLIQHFEFNANRALFAQGWKLALTHRRGRPVDEDAWELYDLSADYNETSDLAGRRPEMVRALSELWWAEAGKYGVLPMNDV